MTLRQRITDDRGSGRSAGVQPCWPRPNRRSRPITASTAPSSKRSCSCTSTVRPRVTVNPDAGERPGVRHRLRRHGHHPERDPRHPALRRQHRARRPGRGQQGRASRRTRPRARRPRALAAQTGRGPAPPGRAVLRAVSGRRPAKWRRTHAALASQAGNELLSATSLQFTPKGPLPAPLSTTTVALEWAFAELGKPYVWGATGPNSFDCSGLTQYVWRQAGVSIPRVAADQYAWTIPVPLSQLLPGDLVFYGTTDIHHVGIYIGDGLMINAPHTGTVVQVSSIWWSDLAGFGRVHAAGSRALPPAYAPNLTQPSTPVVDRQRPARCRPRRSRRPAGSPSPVRRPPSRSTPR